MITSGGAGTELFPKRSNNYLVLGSSASLIGSEYHGHRAPALGSRRGMWRVDFKRVRAEVTEFWSGEPISDPDQVQWMIEWDSPLAPPYPDVKAVEPTRGVWDIYLPEDVVEEFDKRSVKELELEAVERSFRVRFLGGR